VQQWTERTIAQTSTHWRMSCNVDYPPGLFQRGQAELAFQPGTIEIFSLLPHPAWLSCFAAPLI